MPISGFNIKEVTRQKSARMVKMMLRDSEDMLDEALALIFPLFGDVELSVTVSGKLLSCTALNADIREAIEMETKNLSSSKEIVTYDRNSLKLLRPGIQEICIIPLQTGLEKESRLIIEFYSKKSFFDIDKYSYLLNLFTLLVKQYQLNHKASVALRLDSATLLPTREALVERLVDINKRGIKRACLGIISLSNAAELNRTEGMSVVDGLLKGIGAELNSQMPDNVYRMGGTKFAIVFLGDIYSVVPSLESLVDRVLMLDKRIITANVVSPLYDEPYKTIYICESHLRENGEDVVTVVRHEPDVNMGMAQDMYIVNEPVDADDASYADFEEATENSEVIETDVPEVPEPEQSCVVDIDDVDIPETAFSSSEDESDNMDDCNNPSYKGEQVEMGYEQCAEHEEVNAPEDFSDFMKDYDLGFGACKGR